MRKEKQWGTDQHQYRILACNTIADELKLAMGASGIDYPVTWVESGLHNYPNLLKDGLQEKLDQLHNIDFVLLAFGFCGNAVVGLKTGNFTMVIPRVDDCISLLIGSNQERGRIGSTYNAYFITKGWVDNEKNIWEEYNQTVKKYGQQKADGIFKALLNHYRTLGIIDTGAYDLQGFLPTSRMIAKGLNLEHVVFPGTTAFFKKLLTGPYDEDFVIIEPNTEVRFTDLLNKS